MVRIDHFGQVAENPEKCPLVDNRLVQISRKEIQIHGEVSLKKNVQRLVVWWNQVLCD